DIAYDNHDIDDGLRAGLFTVADLEDVPIVGPVFHEVRRRFPDAPPEIKVREAVRRMIGDMVGDLLAEAQRRLADLNPRSVEEIRAQSHPVIAFSARMAEDERALKEFLRESMYSHYKLNRMTSKARRVVRDLFTLLMAEPNCLPTAWRRQAGAAQSAETALAVTDYIAGITDRFALDEHKKLFDVQARAS
ncbi:MAG: deoxyguanosinetriphosphate triphosphohydrolase, partial [Magnetospiraceae bacterium]